MNKLCVLQLLLTGVLVSSSPVHALPFANDANDRANSAVVSTINEFAAPCTEQLLFDGAGPEHWQMFTLRNGKVNASHTAWQLTNQTLTCKPASTSDMVEDFIVTRDTFPVNNVRVDFDVSGDASPFIGYLGTAIGWISNPEQRISTVKTNDPDGLLGFETWCVPGSGRVNGFLFTPEGTKDFPEQLTAMKSGTTTCTHSLLVKDGMISYRVNGKTVAAFPLAHPLPDNTRRHLALSVCFFDGTSGETVQLQHVRIVELKELPVEPVSQQAFHTDLPPANHGEGEAILTALTTLSAALTARDITAAIACFSPEVREKYRNLFSAQPEHLPAIAVHLPVPACRRSANRKAGSYPRNASRS